MAWTRPGRWWPWSGRTAPARRAFYACSPEICPAPGLPGRMRGGSHPGWPAACPKLLSGSGRPLPDHGAARGGTLGGPWLGWDDARFASSSPSWISRKTARLRAPLGAADQASSRLGRCAAGRGALAGRALGRHRSGDPGTPRTSWRRSSGWPTAWPCWPQGAWSGTRMQGALRERVEASLEDWVRGGASSVQSVRDASDRLERLYPLELCRFSLPAHGLRHLPKAARGAVRGGAAGLAVVYLVQCVLLVALPSVSSDVVLATAAWRWASAGRWSPPCWPCRWPWAPRAYGPGPTAGWPHGGMAPVGTLGGRPVCVGRLGCVRGRPHGRAGVAGCKCSPCGTALVVGVPLARCRARVAGRGSGIARAADTRGARRRPMCQAPAAGRPPCQRRS